MLSRKNIRFERRRGLACLRAAIRGREKTFLLPETILAAWKHCGFILIQMQNLKFIYRVRSGMIDDIGLKR